MQLPEKYEENFDVSSEGPSSGVTRALSINTARTVKLLNGTQNVWASDLYLTGKFR
jgi:hypothetical protein